MKILLVLVFLIASHIAICDVIVKGGASGQPDKMWLDDATNTYVPAIVAYTTDGMGNIIPISSGGGGGGAVFIHDSAGNNLTSTGGALDVNVLSSSGAMTVNQGTSPWIVSGTVTANQSGVWNIQDITGSISLPTGASTSALQLTANTSLSSIDGKLNSLGQKTMAGSTPVVLSSDQSAIPVSQSGTWNLNNISGAISLPTGAATSSAQATGNASLASIDSKLTNPLPVSGSLGRTWTLNSATDSVSASFSFPSSLDVNLTEILGAAPSATNPVPSRLTDGIGYLDPRQIRALTASDVVTANAGSGTFIVDGSGVIQPVSAASLPLPAGASTSALQTTGNTSLSNIDSKLTNPLPISGSVSVSNFPATQAVTQSTSPWVVGGTLAATQSGTWTVQPGNTANTTAWKVDGSAVTQPVSGTITANQGGAWTVTANAGTNLNTSALALAATQTDRSQFTKLTDGTRDAVIKAASTAVLAADTSLAVGLSPNSPLPTGSNTIGALSANQSVNLNQVGASAITLGQKAMASSLPVVLASDQTSIPVSATISGTPTVNQGTSPWVVSGTVAATQSGTWTVQPGNTANTTAWKIDGSAVTQPVSGTFFQATQPISAASLPLPTGASTAAKQPAIGAAGTASTDVLSVQGIAAMTPLKVDGSAVTQPVSGTVTANAGSGTFNVTGTGSTGTPATGILTVQGNASGVAIPISGTVTATNASVSTTGAAPPASATYSGGSVTTAAPSYTTGQMSGLSLNTSGGLRVDGSGVTQPISGTVTANQGGAPWSVSQSGTWTVQPGNTANTTAWKVDGSAVTQPVSGTVTANAGTNLNTSALALDATLTNRNQKAQITDGTRDGTVKAASTAAGATDTSLVVGLSPNSPLPTGSNTIGALTANQSVNLAQVGAAAVSLGNKTTANSVPTTSAIDTGTSTLGALNAQLAINCNGASSMGLSLSGTWVGNIQLSGSANGTTSLTIYGSFVDNSSGSYINFTTNGTIQVPCGGLKQVILTMTAYTSGTATIDYYTSLGTGLTKVINKYGPDLQGQVEGPLATGVVASNNPILLGARYNATPETFGDTALVRLLADTNARLVVTNVPRDGVRTTCRTAAVGIASVLTATDIFTITGSASKTIRVVKVDISATQTTAGEANVIFLTRSTANTGGTSTNLTEVPLDSTQSCTATTLSYTANPTAGSLVGNIAAFKYFIPTTLVLGAILTYDFGKLGSAVVLRGTGQVFAVNLNSTTLAGSSFDISAEWTEE